MIVRADRAYIDRSEPSAAEVRGLAEPDRGIANIGMVGIIDERDRSIAQQRRKALVKPGLQPGDAGAAGFGSVRHGGSFVASATHGADRDGTAGSQEGGRNRRPARPERIGQSPPPPHPTRPPPR